MDEKQPGAPVDADRSGVSMVGAPGAGLVAGRFEILGLLGVGGMGSVYRARDVELDEVVALKAIRAEIVDRPGMLERFRREVKLARRVTHANVARVFDMHEHGGEKFLTMELVDGESLADVLARDRRLSLARTVEVAVAVCAGLGAAHAAGVVHRDLKPENVLVAKNGRVVVTDFGVAREGERDPASSPDSTAVGAIVGTPAYMAPEQVEGGPIDHRTDLYALGAMLFELVSGQRPFSGETPLAVAAARLVTAPPDVRTRRSDVPDAFARLVQRCMARRREDRPASAAEVAAELGSLTLPAELTAPGPMSSVRPAATLSAAPTPPRATEKTVAVLPFRNAGAPGDDYLADGVTEDLIDGLSMTKGVRVRPRALVMRFKGAEVDPREIGRELGVQVVVEGSVRRTPGAVRLSARLVGVEDGFQIWAKRFDRPEAELLAVNDEASRDIAAALTADLAKPARAPLTDPVAVDLYLRARHEYNKFWQPNIIEAIALYEQALERAPDDGSILAGYALACMRRAFFVGEGADKARAAAERAIAVAPELGESRLASAAVKFQGGEVVGAVEDLVAAIGRAPGLAEAHFLLGRILAEVGHAEEAIRRLTWCLQLEPAYSLAARDLGRTRALLGEWHLVEREEPAGSPGDQIGLSLDRARFAMWRRDPAALAHVLATLPPSTLPIDLPRVLIEGVLAGRHPFDAPELGEFLRGSQSLRRITYFAQVDAEISLYMGRREQAVAAVERAAAHGLIDAMWIDRCPLLADLVHDPRFVAARAPVVARAAAVVAAFRAAERAIRA
jgi:serine/threonine-protein kinase